MKISAKNTRSDKLKKGFFLFLILVSMFILPSDTNNRKLDFSMYSFDSDDDYMVFNFNQSVKTSVLGITNIPKVEFDPPLEGTFSWDNSRRLRFTPDKSQLRWGATQRITFAPIIPEAGRDYASDQKVFNFRLPYLQAANKVARWETIPGKPRFISVLGNLYNTDVIGSGPLYMLFDQAVDLDVYKTYFSLIDKSGFPIEFTLEENPALPTYFDLDVDPDLLVSIQPTGRIYNGERVILKVPSWNHSRRSEPDIVETVLTVNNQFRLENFNVSNQRTSGAYDTNVTASFSFNNNFDIRDFRERIKITPEPLSMNITNYRKNSLSIRLELEIGKSYHFQLRGAPLQDYLGNSLDETFLRTIRVRDELPSLEVPSIALTTEEGQERIPVEFMNLEEAIVNLYTFPDTRSYIRALQKRNNSSISQYGFSSSDPKTGFIWKFEEQRLNDTVAAEIDLSRHDNQGYKLMDIRGTATGTEKNENAGQIHKTLLYHSSDIGLTAKIHDKAILVWAVNFSNAEPLGNVEIKLYDENGRSLSSALTNSQGIATLYSDDAGVSGTSEILFIEARKEDMVSLMKVDNSELSSPWQFNMAGYKNNDTPVYGSIFTERGVYRPGEKVYLKAYIHPGEGEAPRDSTLKILDPRGKILEERQLRWDTFHSADLELQLSSAAPVGRYDILLVNDNQNISQSFQVEEYRVPTFLVEVNSGPESWEPGKQISASIHAQYYNGGTLGSRKVRWMVNRAQAPMYLSSFPNFIFQSADAADSVGTLISNEDVLNSQGDLDIQFTPPTNSSAGRLRYTLEAVVDDIDRQAYAGRISRFVHPADFYIGVKPPAREVLQSKTSTSVPILVVDTNGTPLVGENVLVEVEYLQNHSSARLYNDGNVQMLNHRTGRRISQERIRSAAAPVQWNFVPDQAGIYRLNFSSQDSQGRRVKTFFYCTVTGDEMTAWPRFDVERIDLVSDKTFFRPGEVAHIVPQTPYEEATVLVTMERSGIMESRIYEIDHDTRAIEIPITGEMTPNVYVSMVLLRGRTHFMKDATGFETGAPGLKIGYTMLRVEPIERELQIEVQRAPSTAAPRQEIRLPVKVKDFAGNGVESQLTVMVVDEAVLAMTNFKTPNPLNEIYTPRALGVRTGSNWLDLPNSRRERREQCFPGGADDPALQVMRNNEILRNLFKSTAYYNPSLRTDGNGNAEIRFEMPDNLTQYRVMIIAADKLYNYGSKDLNIECQKPLMVQPVIPRFLYPEDELSVEALLINNTSETAEIRVNVNLTKIDLRSGGSSKTITLAPHESGTVSFPVKASTAGDALVRFVAQSSTYEDAGEFSLPILNPGTKETIVESVSMDGNSRIELDVPGFFIENSLSAQAVISKTALTELKDSVQYLMRYPNGCIEQTTSRAYPLVVLEDLLPMIGVEVDRAKLKDMADAGINRILSFQTSQGGLAYWPGSDQPHAFATAFGLTALLAARDKGYDIPEHALEGMADYLETSLRSGRITGEMPHGSIPDGDTRALFVMTLGRLGRPQPQYVNALWENKDELTPFGLSFLAIALEEMPGGNKALLDPILEEIIIRAEMEENEAYYSGNRDSGWSMGSPLRTHGGALLAYGITEEDAVTGSKLLSGLLARRRNGLWGNTQENVFGMMGVYEFANASGTNSRSRNNWNLKIQGERINSDSLEAPDSMIRRIEYREDQLGLKAGTPGQVSIESNDRGGFLSLRLSYDIPIRYAESEAKSEGFTMTRTYEDMNGRSLEGKTIPLGTMVRVRLRVNTNSTRHYVAIDDKLPAGLEPMNSNLATTETLQMGELTSEMQKGLSVLSYQEIRDSRVAFFADEMLRGTYEFVYIAKATTPGRFLRPFGRAETMYDPDIFGRTTMDYVEIR